MAKFYGKIGYSHTVEVRPGVHEDRIVERPYFGDVVQAIRKNETSEKVLDDVVIQNIISVVADPYALDHFFAIKYVEWSGVRWTVPYVEVERPRLILRPGKVYNGPTPEPTGTP